MGREHGSQSSGSPQNVKHKVNSWVSTQERGKCVSTQKLKPEQHIHHGELLGPARSDTRYVWMGRGNTRLGDASQKQKPTLQHSTYVEVQIRIFHMNLKRQKVN